MNRRHTDVSYLKVALWTLLVLVLLVGSILNNAVAADLVRAPVVTPGATSDDVMLQTGWLTYDSMEDAVILYCVPAGNATLTCVVFTVTDKGGAVVLVKDVKASEAKT